MMLLCWRWLQPCSITGWLHWVFVTKKRTFSNWRDSGRNLSSSIVHHRKKEGERHRWNINDLPGGGSYCSSHLLPESLTGIQVNVIWTSWIGQPGVGLRLLVLDLLNGKSFKGSKDIYCIQLFYYYFYSTDRLCKATHDTSLLSESRLWISIRGVGR